jgi:hypothetical protein
MAPTDVGTPARAPRGAGSIERLVVKGDLHAVMREQLDFLIEHAEAGCGGCSFCDRYARAKSMLLEIFAD